MKSLRCAIFSLVPINTELCENRISIWFLLVELSEKLSKRLNVTNLDMLVPVWMN